MKKLLALVLALVMTLGLATVGANAATYSDAADISLDEAVDVMSALKVFDGMDGAFNPKGNLTREMGAKIIASMIIGRTAADALANQATQFTDVAADRWSAGPIAFCASEGIIGGMNAEGTIFAPEATLTGYQFAKMCLVALGYDAKLEGLYGETFTINTAKLALSAGLLSSLDDVTMSQPLTREQAAQMALNTEQGTMVEYKGGVSVSGDGNLSVTVAADRNAVARTTGNNYNRVAGGINTEGANANQAGNGTLQFCEQYAAKLLKVASADDAFGRPVDHKWTLSGTDVASAPETAAVTFTAETSAADVAKALADYTIPYGGGANYMPVNNVTTGVQTSDAIVVENEAAGTTGGTTTIDRTATVTTAKAIANLTANGKLVEIFADSQNHITDVITTQYSIRTISNVTKLADRTSYQVSGVGTFNDFTDASVSDTVSFKTAPAKGDVVTVTVRGGKAYIYPTTSIEGTQTTYSTSTTGGTVRTTIVLDGTTYSIGNGISNIVNASFNNTKGITYFDQYGFAALRTNATASTDYVYLVDATATVAHGLDGDTPTVTVRAVLADGTVGTYTLAVAKVATGDGVINTTPLNDNDAITNNNAENFVAGDWYVKGTARAVGGPIKVYDAGHDTYATGANIRTAILTPAAGVEPVYGYTLSDGVLTLEKVTELEANLTQSYADTIRVATLTGTAGNYLAKGKTSYDSETDKDVLADSNTTFVIYNASNKKATVYTGSANLPSATVDALNITGYAVAKMAASATGRTDVGTAQVIFATGAVAADAAPDYVYIDATKYSTTDSVKSYTGYTKTQDQTITLSDKKNVVNNVSGLYSYNADNQVVARLATITSTIAAATDFYEYTNGFVESGSLLGVNGTYWNYSADTANIVYLNGASGVNGNSGYVVLKSNSGNHTSEVETVFVTSSVYTMTGANSIAQINTALATANNVVLDVANGASISDAANWGAKLTIPAGKTLTINSGNLTVTASDELEVNGTLYISGAGADLIVTGNSTNSKISGSGIIYVADDFQVTTHNADIDGVTINVGGTLLLGATAGAVTIGGTTAAVINATGNNENHQIGTSSQTSVDLKSGSKINVTGSGCTVSAQNTSTTIDGELNVTGATAASGVTIADAMTAKGTIYVNGKLTNTGKLTLNGGKVTASSLDNYTDSKITAGTNGGEVVITALWTVASAGAGALGGGGSNAMVWEFQRGITATNTNTVVVNNAMTVKVTGGALTIGSASILSTDDATQTDLFQVSEGVDVSGASTATGFASGAPTAPSRWKGTNNTGTGWVADT